MGQHNKEIPNSFAIVLPLQNMERRIEKKQAEWNIKLPATQRLTFR